VRILAIQRPRQHDPTEPGREIRMMHPPNALEMVLERVARRVRQHHTAILLALPPPNCDLSPLEIEILHPKLKALLQSNPGAIEQHRDDPGHTSERVQHLSHFGHGQHTRHLRGHPRPRQQLDGADLLVLDLCEDSAGRLAVLGTAVDATRTLAFYLHTDVETRGAALAAGCDLVVPRSRIAREGAALVDGLAAADGNA